ncbi:hypothetical protein, partial [Bacillus mobilis]|uniref:hypothetical protein n=1 Tax=Bacillus mobilis TaxID=2026190 RepID=UPI0022E29044
RFISVGVVDERFVGQQEKPCTHEEKFFFGYTALRMMMKLERSINISHDESLLNISFSKLYQVIFELSIFLVLKYT